MQTFKIEVDEAVWSFLRQNAKDATEKPNDVLKRVLSIQDVKPADQAVKPKYGDDWSCS